jgi:tetratricopeptide (TPR) repeat protein
MALKDLATREGFLARLSTPWGGAIGWAMGAGILYICTMTWHPVAGASARLIDSYAGLNPNPPYLNSAWGCLVLLVDQVPVGTLAQRLNLLSAFFGAMGVGGLYLFLRHFPMLRQRRPDTTAMSILRSSVASLYLLFCFPFWHISTRAHPLPFDVVLLLASVLLLGLYHRTGRVGSAFGSAVLFGICIAEYSTAPALLLLYAPMWFYILWRKGKLEYRLGVSLGLAMTLSAVTVYLWGAWRILSAPAIEWNGEYTLYRALRTMAGLEFRDFARGLPRTGWLLVLMVSALPWIGCFSSTRTGKGRRFRGSLILMLSVIMGISIAVHFNMPIAPWYLMGEGHPLVFPYLLLASCTGYLSVYGYRYFRENPRFARWNRARIARAYVICIVGLLVVSGARTALEIRPPATRALYTCAQAIVDAAGERTIIFTDGVMDSLMRIVAHERGRPLHVISIRMAENREYRSYLGHLFKAPQLASLADAGLEPMLKAALMAQPELADRIALQRMEELWVAAGYTPVADRLIYAGIGERSEVDLHRLYRENLAFWESVEVKLKVSDPVRGGIQAAMAAHMMKEISRSANDLGVFLDVQGEAEMAETSYLTAIRFRNDNVPARLNHYVLAGTREGFEKEAESALQDLSHLLSDRPIPMHALVKQFGRVRSQEALNVFEELSGIKAHSDSEAADPQFVEATQAYMKGELETSAALLDSILRKRDEKDAVWLLRGLVANRAGDKEMWNRCWDEMKKRGRTWTPFLVLRMKKAIDEGNVETAREYGKSILAIYPDADMVLESMARLEYFGGDEVESKKYVQRLLTINPWNPVANGILGTMQASRGEHEKAISALRVATHNQHNPLFLNNLAWVLHATGQNEEALEIANLALKQFPDLGGTWDTKGQILLAMDRLPEAKEAMDRAAELAPQHSLVTLHQAELADRLGNEDERDWLLNIAGERRDEFREEETALYEALMER